MRATKAWADVTGRPISVKTHEWINDLVDRWGDERVADAVEAEARANPTKLGTLLTRTRDRLAAEDLRVEQTPTFVDRDWLMAIVHGERLEPEGRYYYDAARLSADEYGELVGWVAARQMRVGVPA
jgi:hypothetical protein